MEKNTLPIVAGLCLLALITFTVGGTYVLGVGGDTLPWDDGTKTVPDPEVNVSASYDTANETVTLRVENGDVGPSEGYTEVFVQNPDRNGTNRRQAVTLRSDDERSSTWGATEEPRLTALPLTEGDTVVVVTVDDEDDDGDGTAGIDEGDTFELVIRHESGGGRVLLSLQVVDGELVSVGN